MTKQEEAAAIAAEVEAADKAAPRARTLATEIRGFLYGVDAALYMPALDYRRWEDTASDLGAAGMVEFGARRPDVSEAEESRLRTEFEAFKAKARPVGAGRI